jgi:ATP-dependent DNA helicase RecG
MKGEDQLKSVLKLTREEVAADKDATVWFESVADRLKTPGDGSDEATWDRLLEYAKAYRDSGRDRDLWKMIGGLYDLSRWYLERPVTRVKGVGDARADSLENLDIFTLYDLITHYPRAYTDRRFVDDIRDLKDDQTASVLGEVLAGGVVEGRKPRYEVRLGDDTGQLRINFWNQTYLKDQLTRGKELFCTGKVEDYRGTIQMNNPDFEIIEDEGDLRDSKGIKPIYPLTEGIYLKQLREWVDRALDMTEELMMDCLPEPIRSEHNLVSYRKALRDIHQPDDIDNLLAARRRLIFEEFFFYQSLFVLENWAVDSTKKNRSYPRTEWRENFLSSLDFELTGDQQNALDEIESDLESESPMHRLLQGDVGTGKTVVATASLLRVAENGYQTALMAPTEVLAEQHFETLTTLLKDSDCRIRLLVGGMDESRKKQVLESVHNGEVDIVVGTHALIQGDVDFSDLGYVVIDEQHRFGVEQRRNLREKGPEVDMLVMSATPIPRSLALTQYGDLQFSTLEEFPHGPKNITTELLDQTDSNRGRVYREVRNAVESGAKAFFVFPAVEENEETDMTPAVESYEKARESNFFGDVGIGLIHGQMSREDKQQRMQKFHDGTVQILFSTTVIEVGIDVPEASYLVVHEAENFGLAQLHQLRGRIGRAGQDSTCYLLVGPGVSEESRERLQVLESTHDGFEVSQADLKQRGSGDLAGTRQAGVQPFELGDIFENRSLMEEAREAAEDAVQASDALERPAYSLTARKLQYDYHDAMDYVRVG